MKIINIILTSQNGGAEQAFVDYLVVLKNLGHEVLAIIKDDAPYEKQILDFGIAVKKIKNRFGYHDIFAIKQLRKIIEDFAADAVFAHIGRSMVLVKKSLKKISNKKVFFVAVNHSMNVNRSIGADVIFSVNQKAFHKTIDLGQREDRSFVIPNAINLDGAIEEIAEINLTQKRTIALGAMGRIDDKKGFEHLITAISQLNKIGQKKFILKIAGSGSYETNLRQLAKDLKVENEVEFLGWTENKKEFFAAIDIFCSASSNETFGLVLLEAMKYSKPIIATDTDGSKEILKDGIDGILIGLNSAKSLPEKFSAAVIEIINQQELPNILVKNAARKLREKYSYAALEQRLAEIVGRA
jgi:glycosyltransferase involved in cell wall biosynthesis